MKVNLITYNLDGIVNEDEDIIISKGNYDEMLNSKDISVKTPAAYFNAVRSLKEFNDLNLRGGIITSNIELLRDEEKSMYNNLINIIKILIESAKSYNSSLNDELIIVSIDNFKYHQDKDIAHNLLTRAGFVSVEKWFPNQIGEEYSKDLFVFASPMVFEKIVCKKEFD